MSDARHDNTHPGTGDAGFDAAHDVPGAEKQSVKAGHEPDKFAVRSILYVPLIMVVVVIGAFVVVTITFNGLTVKPPLDESKNVQATQDSQKTVNARFANISSTDPEARTNQPRLEYLKQTEGNDPADPPFYRSKRPVEAVGATWELRPEDLRPQNFVDPLLKRKILVEYGWADDAKKLAHFRIEDAMLLMAPLTEEQVKKDESLRKLYEQQQERIKSLVTREGAVEAKKKLTAVKGAKEVPVTTDGRPKISNSGRGGPSQPANPASPPQARGKTEDKPAPVTPGH